MNKLNESELHRTKVRIGERYYEIVQDADLNQYWLERTLENAVRENLEDGGHYFDDYEEEGANEDPIERRTTDIMRSLIESGWYKFLDDYGIYSLFGIK